MGQKDVQLDASFAELTACHMVCMRPSDLAAMPPGCPAVSAIMC